MNKILVGGVASFVSIVLAVMVSAGGIALAGGTEVRERAKLTLQNGGMAEVELQLRIRDGEKELRVKAEVTGLPIQISPRDRFALCVGGTFIDDDRVDEDGEVVIDDEVEGGFSFATLVGQAVSIVNIGQNRETCSGTTMLDGTVMASDLE